MGLLKIFLGKYLTAIELVVIALLLATVGVQTVRLSSAKTELAEYRTTVATERQQQQAAALIEAKANADETERRTKQQQENQHVQDQELAAARNAAARNAADAQRVRQQSAVAASQWRARLADSPTREDLEAAGVAIDVLTDLFGRADRRAGELAVFSDTSRAAGLKCERDYDALSAGKQ